MVHIIEVCNKAGIPDVFGQEIKKSIAETGIRGVDSVLTSEIYRFEGVLRPDELDFIAEEILVDAVSQEYFTDGTNIAVRRNGYRAIDVFYKSGVTDSTAGTVLIALNDAGIKTEYSVSTGKRYYLRGALTEKDVETVCAKVLANSLIQEYSIITPHPAPLLQGARGIKG